MPSRVALWALNLSNRLLVAWLATRALAGVFVVAANVASAVALLVTAFQLAWPPFAYAIKDDDEARARLPLRAHASGCSSRSRSCCRSRSPASG